MRLSCILTIGAFLLAGVSGVTAAGWNTSFETAKQHSRSSGLPILMNFTGSDWCPACIRLRAQVLTHPSFTTFASKRVILMEVDFPRRIPMAALHRQANEQLAQRYGVTAFPTLLLVDSQGTRISQIHGGGSPEALVSTLDTYLTQLGSTGRSTTTSPTPPPRTRSAPARELPLFGGAATRPVPTYTNLVVKSITKTPSRRFVLINSETLASGEAAWFNLGRNKVKVQCVEVREKSVLIRVDGEAATRELLLSDISR